MKVPTACASVWWISPGSAPITPPGSASESIKFPKVDFQKWTLFEQLSESVKPLHPGAPDARLLDLMLIRMQQERQLLQTHKRHDNLKLIEC